MQNKHVLWIDDARTLTMLLVIIGHCTYTNLMTHYGGISYFSNVSPEEYSFGEKLLTTMVSFIYTFHMPLFMMLSGACFSLTIHKVAGLKAFVSNKAKRLLVPFLFTTLLLSVPLKYMSGYYAESANVLEDIVLGQFLLMGNSHLWFVASLFWIFLMYYGLHQKHLTDKRWFLPSLVGVSIVATYFTNKGIEFLGILAAFKHLVYFAFGFKHLRKLDATMWGGKSLLLNIVVYSLLFIAFLKYGNGDTVFMKAAHYIYTVVMGVYGSIIMIQFAKYFGTFKCITKLRLYRTFSRYSYELYLFSDPFNYVLVYLTYLGLGDFVTSNVDAFLAFFIRLFGTIILAMLVIWIKNKIQSVKCIHGTISKS